jgi:hypothetical protein
MQVREGRIVTTITFDEVANLFPGRRAAPTSSFLTPIEDKYEAMQVRTSIMVYKSNAGDFLCFFNKLRCVCVCVCVVGGGGGVKRLVLR